MDDIAAIKELYRRTKTNETTRRNPSVDLGDLQTVIGALTSTVRAAVNVSAPVLVLSSGLFVLGVSKIWVDSSTGSKNVQLPNVNTLGLCTDLTIKDHRGSAGANPINILTFGSARIDGQMSKVINTNYGSLTIAPDLTDGDWHVTSMT